MLATFALALVLSNKTPSSAPDILQCVTGVGSDQSAFTLSIDRDAKVMVVSSRNFAPTTMPVFISRTTLKARGPIHYNMTSFEITLPDLKVRRTEVPHLWPGPVPTLISEGQCSGDFN